MSQKSDTPSREDVREAKITEARTRRFLKENPAYSANRLARAAGMSASSVSQFLNGSYRGNVATVAKKLDAVLDRERDKKLLHKPSGMFIETTVTRRIFEVARIAHVWSDIGVCISEAGLGKTESVRRYHEQHTDAILIEADPGYTASVLFGELHDKLGNGGRSTLHNMFDDCVRRLRESGRMLIIDEAEQLPYKALEMVRRLHDKSNVGILLIGMPRLLANLRGLRGEYAQLYSRVGISIKLSPLTKNDVKEIVGRTIPESNGIWQEFYKRSGANTRALMKLIRRSVHISNLNKTTIDSDVLDAACSQLIK